jgi:hypothetical protein
MKSIPLKGGAVALVDDDMYPTLHIRKWYLHKSGYAYATTYDTGTCKFITTFMHRVVNNTPMGLETDHINNNPLDNRRENLRSVTHRQNCANKIHKDTLGMSGALGVRYEGNKWTASIQVFGKLRRLGGYDTLEEASEIRNAYKNIIDRSRFDIFRECGC